jgi:hypothetical protein
MMGAVVSAARSRSRAALVAAPRGSIRRLSDTTTQGLERTRSNAKPFHAGTILWGPRSYSFSYLRRELILLYPTRRN